MYGPKQVSEILDISVSTLRRYSVDFADILSDGAKRTGGKRFYTDQDILILKKIRSLSAQHKSHAEIRKSALLVDQPPPGELALIPAIAAEFEQLRSQIARLQSDQDENRAAIDQLRKELEARRPWWAKIIRRNKS